MADTEAPIPLSREQIEVIRSWARDDRLWSTQETTEFNLCAFARKIMTLAANQPAPATADPIKARVEKDLTDLQWRPVSAETPCVSVADVFGLVLKIYQKQAGVEAQHQQEMADAIEKFNREHHANFSVMREIDRLEAQLAAKDAEIAALRKNQRRPRCIECGTEKDDTGRFVCGCHDD